MESVQKVIEIPTFIDIVDFLGPNDRYLNMVRKKFDARVKFQNRAIFIYGLEEQVQKVYSTFLKVLEVLESGEKVLEQDIDLFLRQIDSGKIPQTANDVILKIGKNVVKAKTQHQKEYVDAIENNIITFAIGVAGSSKTYLAVTSAVKALHEKKVDKVVITRPPVALQGYSIGYTPGSDVEKTLPWLAPLLDVFGKFYSQEKIDEMIEKKIIDAIPLGYMRGRSFENSFIVFDEAQNSSIEAFKSVLTRLAVGSKIVVCGDTQQTDINGMSGLETAAKIMEGADGVAIVRFGIEDIVRSGITAEVIKRFAEAGF